MSLLLEPLDRTANYISGAESITVSITLSPSEQLALWARRRGVTAKDMANNLKISRPTIAKWFNDDFQGCTILPSAELQQAITADMHMSSMTVGEWIFTMRKRTPKLSTRKLGDQLNMSHATIHHLENDANANNQPPDMFILNRVVSYLKENTDERT